METIEWADFEKIDLRAGTIVRAEIFEEANRPAYKLWIDLGAEIGLKKSSSQLTNYTLKELEGLQVMCVVNFPPKQIAQFMSEVLVTGFVLQGQTILSTPLSPVPNGAKLS